jgi:phosphate-selective porin OprO and OprP
VRKLYLVLISAFSVAYSWAGDSGPFSPLSFGSGIEFHEPYKKYHLNLRFRMQNLVSVATAENVGEDTEYSALIRRARLRLSGWAVSPNIGFVMQLSFSRNDMDWDNTEYPHIIRDAVVVWKVTPGLQFSLGQSKLPGNRQRLVSSGEMQFADRSIVNRSFNIDRDSAIQSQWSWRVGTVLGSIRAAISTGDGRAAVNEDDGLAYTARAEVLPLGAFKNDGDYFESDLAFETDPRLSIGAGFSYNDRSRRSAGQLGVTLSQARTFQSSFADLVLKYRGLSVYLEYMRRDCSNPIVDSSSNQFVLAGHGWLAQAGYLFAEDWEVAARYATVQPFASVRALEPITTQYTLGMTRFLNGHRVKVQADLTWNEERRVTVTQNWIGRLQVELGI